MTKPHISIIVPVYNVEDYLPKCLDSVLNQTMEDIEIICVNDGSKDGSLSILNDYAKKDERIIIHNQQNAGVSVARNNGLKLARGDYYMFIDSDDWLEPETCEVALARMLAYRADCLMFSYVKEFSNHSIVNHIFEKDFVWEKDEVLTSFHRRLFGLIGNELAKPQDGDIIVSPCMQLFRTSKYKDIQFYDIRKIGSFEDGLYQMDIYKNCNRFVYIDKPYYHYRKTNTESITTKYNPHLIEQWLNLFEIIENKIPVDATDDYRDALNNRICLSLIGIGFNEIKSSKSFNKKVETLRSLLKTPKYKVAYGNLSLGVFPLYWRAFFFLAKYKLIISLIMLLYIMEYFRKHKQ